MLYDTIIAGGGPAGYSAALYLAMAGYKTLVIEKLADGGQMALTDTIDNYPGFDEGISGFELGQRMKKGAIRFGAETLYAEIDSISAMGDEKSVSAGGKEYKARSLIIATGASPRRLGVPNENELTGMGVHYCAHCDGRFYQGKTVAVVGGGNSALEDAAYLSKLAKEVILIHRRGEFRASRHNRERLKGLSNLRIMYSSSLSELTTDNGMLVGIKVRTADGEETIRVDGVFISIGRTPESSLILGQVDTDANGYIIADETTVTNIPGVFAAGDIRTKPLRQVVTAAADGAVSATRAEEYLGMKKF